MHKYLIKGVNVDINPTSMVVNDNINTQSKEENNVVSDAEILSLFLVFKSEMSGLYQGFETV